MDRDYSGFDNIQFCQYVEQRMLKEMEHYLLYLKKNNKIEMIPKISRQIAIIKELIHRLENRDK